LLAALPKNERRITAPGLMRRVYREAFCLIGVVCETETRRIRLREAKCTNSTPTDVERFIARDEDADITHGQKVAETFHLADFFCRQHTRQVGGW